MKATLIVRAHHQGADKPGRLPQGARRQHPLHREGQLPTLAIRDPPMAMNTAQRLPASLTALDAALAAFLHGIESVAVVELPLREALGCVVAEMPPVKAYPQHDVAQADGWAFRTRDLVGASSYTPLPLTMPARWVEAGDPIPTGCDCVIERPPATACVEAATISRMVSLLPPARGFDRSISCLRALPSLKN